METKEQHLENIIREKNLELETHFNNLIRSGNEFTYGSGIIHVAGGREALAGLQGLYTFYQKHGVGVCPIRNPLTGRTTDGTIEEMGTLIGEVFDWGFDNYYINIKKQDYVLDCATVENVLDVTWESAEISGIL